MTGVRLILLTCLAAAAATSVPHAEGDTDSGLIEEFRSACRALSKENIGDSRNLVSGRDGWVYYHKELLHAATPSFWGTDAAKANPNTKPDLADPIPAIVDFNNQLAAEGIKLLFVPVPGRPIIYPEGVLEQARMDGLNSIPVLNSAHSDFLAEVRSHGVNVIDLQPLFLKKRNTGGKQIFCRLDAHWTPYGIQEAAGAIAKYVADKPWFSEIPKRQFAIEVQSVTRPGPLLKKLQTMGFGDGHDVETFVYRQTRLKAETGTSRVVLRNPDSPIVIIGDSYSIWWNDINAGLGQQLAGEIGFPVDSLSTTGGGITATRINLVRTMRSEPGYLDGKKLLIWCFGGRSLSTSSEGWRKIPLSAPQ